MNIVFGTTACAPSAPDLAGAIGRIHGRPAELVAGGPDEPVIGRLRGAGVVLGQAAAEGLTLAFLGPITGPLPGWHGGSPLDDPDATAQFLLTRYRERGLAFLDGLVGQFAVALADRAAGRLLLGVDPGGMRSFYLHRAEGRLSFSSNLFVLAQGLGAGLAVDRALEDFFLIHGFYPWGRTPYRDVTALPPGKLFEWRRGEERLHDIQAGDPWAGRFKDRLDPEAPEEQLLDVLHEAFLTATEEQLASDPRASVLLGGFDSALVASLLQRLGKKVETYSFFYEESAYNQPHTETLAGFLGIEHHWVPITRATIESGLEGFPRVFNQPTNWPNYVIQTDRLCQVMARQGFRYCYSGDGCDATFLGYPGTYRRARVFQALPRLPEPALRLLLALAVWPALDRRLGHPYRVFLNMLRALGRDMPARGYLSFRIMDEVSLEALRADAPPQAIRPLEEIIRALALPFASLPPLRLAYQGKAAVSPNRNKIIGSSDHNGLAILSPYMHPGMKALATQLPESLMRPKARTRAKVTGKYILMRMAEAKGLLPPEVIYQKKVAAVDGPIDRWYAGPMRPLLLRLLGGLPFDCREDYLEDLLRPKYAEALFKRHVMTDKVISHAASLLTTYATFTAAAQAQAPQRQEGSARSEMEAA